jgi:hypothetical protein
MHIYTVLVDPKYLLPMLCNEGGALLQTLLQTLKKNVDVSQIEIK